MALEFSWQLPLCDTDGTTPWAHRPEQWIQLAQAVEYAGLDGLWIPGGLVRRQPGCGGSVVRAHAAGAVVGERAARGNAAGSAGDHPAEFAIDQWPPRATAPAKR